MSVQTKEILKSYFETGDKPTQAQFADLIDSCFNLPELVKRTATVSEISNTATAVTLTISGSKAQLQHTVTYLYTELINNNDDRFVCGSIAFVHDTPDNTSIAALLYSSTVTAEQRYIAVFTINTYNTAYISFITTNAHTEFKSIFFTYIGCAYATY